MHFLTIQNTSCITSYVFSYMRCSVYIKTFGCCCYRRSYQAGSWSALQESFQEESPWNPLVAGCMMSKSKSAVTRLCFSVDGRRLLTPTAYRGMTSCSFVTSRNHVLRFWSLVLTVARKFSPVPASETHQVCENGVQIQLVFQAALAMRPQNHLEVKDTRGVGGVAPVTVREWLQQRPRPLSSQVTLLLVSCIFLPWIPCYLILIVSCEILCRRGHSWQQIFRVWIVWWWSSDKPQGWLCFVIQKVSIWSTKGESNCTHPENQTWSHCFCINHSEEQYPSLGRLLGKLSSLCWLLGDALLFLSALQFSW